MKKNLSSIIVALKAVFSDYINIYFNTTVLVLFAAVFLIWNQKLRYEDLYVFSLNGIYPVRFLLIIVLINTFLAIFSYEKEKEICYLLLGTNIFISALLLVLEIFYLMSLNYG